MTHVDLMSGALVFCGIGGLKFGGLHDIPPLVITVHWPVAMAHVRKVPRAVNGVV